MTIPRNGSSHEFIVSAPRALHNGMDARRLQQVEGTRAGEICYNCTQQA